MLLMYVEFGVGDWLEKFPVLYGITHQVCPTTCTRPRCVHVAARPGCVHVAARPRCVHVAARPRWVCTCSS